MIAERNTSELIAELCKKVRGIGPSKGFAVAEYFDNSWDDFLDADASELLSIVKKGDKKVLRMDEAEQIVEVKEDYNGYRQVRDAWIYHVGKDFLLNQISTLQAVSLDGLDINPFLMKVLNLKTPKDVLEFNLYQTVTRSIVTSWGSAVEVLLVRCGADPFIGKSNGRSGRRPDIVKERKEKTYYIQVKSGPNTMNVDMVHSLNEIIRKYKKDKPDIEFLLGMTYGRNERVSSQIRDNLDDFENSTLIGRELWDFVSEEKDFHKHLFQLLDSSSNDITDKTFSEHLENQFVVLQQQWKDKYGSKSLNEVFEYYL